MPDEILTANHSIYYGNSKDMLPSASEVGDALKAIENLIQIDTVQILKRIFPNTEIPTIEVGLHGYSTGGSGLISFGLTWLLDQAKDIKISSKTVKGINKWLKKNVPGYKKAVKNKKLIAALIIALACGAGLNALYAKVFNSDESITPIQNIYHGDYINLEGQYNSAIKIAGSELGVDPNLVHQAVQSQLRQARTRNDGARVVAPARRDPAAYIELDSAIEMRLSPEAIAEYPRSVIVPAEERINIIESVRMELRALDYDNRKKWAAIIEQIDPGQRHPLYVRIERPGLLMGATWCVGRVLVKRVQDDDGEWKVHSYELIAIHETSAARGLFSDDPNED